MTGVRFEGGNPIFRVADLAASLEHYAKALGFAVEWEDPGGIACVARGGCQLFLCQGDQGHPGAWAWVGVEDAEALHREYLASGARVRLPPSAFPWALEMQVEDLDGNVLRLGSEPLPDRPRGEWLDVRGDRWAPRPGGGWERRPGAAPARPPRLTSLAPQLRVRDLARSIEFYRRLGFDFGEPWGGFYAIGVRDGLELHLKEAPVDEAGRRRLRAGEHLDAAAGVDGIEAFHAACVAGGVAIVRPLAATPWGTKDFYVEDPDGHVISFGGRPAAG